MTVQWSIISEGLNNSHHHKGPHSAGLLSSGSSVTVHHNLFAHNDIRNPRVRQQADIVNNVIYNWGIMATSFGWSTDGSDPLGITTANLQNNYLVAGPSTELTAIPIVAYDDAHVWVVGNAVEYDSESESTVQPVRNARASEGLASRRHDFPRVSTESALVAYQKVLNQAGASITRDPVDRRIVRDITNASGRIIDTPKQVNAFSNAQDYSITQRRDSDGDGMADTWELTHGLNALDSSDGTRDADGDGWTNLEEYLDDLARGLIPPDYVLVGQHIPSSTYEWASGYRKARSNVAGSQEISPPFATNVYDYSGRRITLASQYE